jgi:hypothetical protein
MRKLILTAIVVAPLLCGCQRAGDQRQRTAANGSSATGTAVTGTAAPAPLDRPAPADRGIGASPSGPEWREVVVPAGTRLDIRLENSVASDTSHVEQQVRAELVDSVIVRGATAIAAGSTVSGTVTNAKRSGRVKGLAELGIRFDTVRPKNADAVYRMRTGVVTRRAPNTHKKDALTILGPAAGGAILGGLFGGKKGALIGTTVGGGAGTAVVLTTRGKEVRLPRGTRLAIKLMDPLTVHVPA